MKDTTDQVAALQTRIHQRLGGAGRLRLAVEMSLAARGLALARLRAEHPDWSRRELNRELLRYAMLSSGAAGNFE